MQIKDGDELKVNGKSVKSYDQLLGKKFEESFRVEFTSSTTSSKKSKFVLNFQKDDGKKAPAKPEKVLSLELHIFFDALVVYKEITTATTHQNLFHHQCIYFLFEGS